MKLSLVEKMKKVINESGNPSYSLIAQFLIKNKNLDYKNLTIFSLAKKTNTSAPTITRFCKSIGIDGFKELIFLLKNDGHELLRKIDGEILNTPSGERGVIFTQNVMGSIEDTFIKNKAKLENIAKEMKSKKRLFFFGLGSNAVLIKMITDLLVRMNFNVIFSKATEQQMAYAENITNNDFVCIVSVSLSDPIFAWMMEKPNIKKIDPVFITRRTSAPVLKNTIDSNILDIGFSENNLGVRFSSEISILFLLKTLLVYLMDDDLANAINKAEI